MRELTTVQENILDRALYAIGKKGSSEVSVREIAREAGVNVSAINYYFRSKNEMFEQMEEFFITNFAAAYSILEDDTYNIREKLLLWSNEIMEYTIRYPGIFVIIREKISEKEESKMGKFLNDSMKEWNMKVTGMLKDFLKSDDEYVLKYSMAILLSSILYPSNFSDITGIDPEITQNREARLRYVEYILDTLKRNYRK